MDAPLGPEREDPIWVGRLRSECEARAAGLVPFWVVASPETARQRLRVRGELRDWWELEHWAESLARRPYDAPSGAAFAVRNDERDATETVPDTLVRTILA
jgi:hypothetical protein